MKLFRIVALWCFMLFALAGLQPAQAQENAATTAQPDVEMADMLRQDGKIYVVVVVLLTVLGGVLLYLVVLDRKVTKLEKQLHDDLVNR
ncbi:CcmD family protein [Pontibacter sp. CAU 1760]